MKDGIVVFLKPTGLTSSQAVGRIRRALGRRDVGHLGTLDPFAAGVLPVAVGRATKLFDLYLSKTKLYRAFFAFGRTSDTLDSDGAVREAGFVPTVEDTIAAAQTLVGTYPQFPPAVSAKSVNGTRAYDAARRGEALELPPKNVTVYRADYRGNFGDQTIFDIECGAGTYIRSFARDLGKKLGTEAIVTALIRLRSGEFSIDDAVTEEELNGMRDRAVLPLETVLSRLPRVDVDSVDYKRITNGVSVDAEAPEKEPFVVFCKGELIGLGKADGGRVGIRTYLKERT